MKLPRPPDLPAALAERYERVAARVADLDVVLPSAVAADAAHVLMVSDFVLGGRYAHFTRWTGAGARDLESVRHALEACDAGDLGARVRLHVREMPVGDACRDLGHRGAS